METVTRQRTVTLNDLAAGFLSLIMRIRSSSELGDAGNLRSRIMQMFVEMDSRGKETGTSGEDLIYAKYALTAFIDEAILSSQWDGRESWLTHPLQLDFFGIHVAGEEFFNKLAEIRQMAGARIEALELYYTCMQLGYEGKYKILGTEKLKILIEEVGRDIERVRGRQRVPLSAHSERPRGSMEEISRGVPVWVWGVACLAFVFVVFTGLAFWLGMDVSATVKELGRIVQASGS